MQIHRERLRVVRLPSCVQQAHPHTRSRQPRRVLISKGVNKLQQVALGCMV